MKNKGKIHVITKYFIPVVAGIEVNILETYSVLAKEGWDITIHTSKDTYLQKGHLADTDEVRGLKIVRYPFRWYGFSPKIDWTEKTLVALHNFDIFPHLQIMVKTLFLKLLGKKQYKLFLTPHGGYNPEWSIFSSLSALIKRTYTYTLGTWLINSSVDGVRAVSDWENAEMKKKGIKRSLITTIANGLEDDAFLSDDKKVLSGGFVVNSSTVTFYTVSNYPSAENAWTASVHRSSTSTPWDMSVYAICANTN